MLGLAEVGALGLTSLSQMGCDLGKSPSRCPSEGDFRGGPQPLALSFWRARSVSFPIQMLPRPSGAL